VLGVRSRIALIDLALTLLEQDPIKACTESLAAIREPASGDCSVQGSQVRFCQTYWYLNCHTLSIPETVENPRVNEARVARLATTDPDGRPHLVPVVFVLEGETLYSPVDRKPKRSQTLRRIENARARPDVTILVDHYEEDWDRLWWIRLRGRARVLEDGEERDRALALLRDKYPQYRDEPPDGPVLAVDIAEVREWRAST